MADAEQAAARFRLRPRRAWAVWAMLAFGGALCVLPFVYGVTGTPRLIDLVAGLGVIATASLYLGAPTWRSCVRIDQRGLALESPRGERFHLDWNEVTEVIADQDEQAAFVRGPSSARSFLVPSSAHPAPYRIERSAELYARIVAAVPEE
ncbi:MAG TPA: hypothetical protein VKN99_25615, partial [Polyangia bacterium]|nr:hypothetical protein [Polyangia bacterium]